MQTGDAYGKWTVIGVPKNGTVQCRCECGTERNVFISNLIRGRSKQCNRCKSFAHGDRSSSEYRSWGHMLQRCTNPNNDRWKDYGGRGITVCNRWLHSYENFLTDMGRKPGPEYSLDRQDVDGPYSPENCRWSTHKEQSQNTRNNTLISFDGMTLPIATWADRTGISRYVLYSRIKRGWTLERLFS